MADVDFDDFDDSDSPARGRVAARLPYLLSLAGAASSVALVIGLGIWGYQLAVRDVSGIPVVRALSGPMRIAPDNPGGEVAAHQGLAVNDVAAIGVAAPPTERLVLAPRPVELTEEDAAAESPNAAGSAEGVVAIEPVPDALAPVVVPPQTADTITATDPDAVAMALAEALAADLSSTADEGVVPLETIDQPVMTGTATRPRPRPADTASSGQLLASAPALAPAQTPLALAEPVPEVDPSVIPDGTRLVQLGAFDTPEQARGEWTRLSAQFGPLFAGKALVVQQADSGGRTFYRLRAHGFADEAETRAFCIALLEQKASCIPAEQR